MHLYLDTADTTELARVLPSPVVHGVTTNPTLLRRAGVAWDALPELVRRVEELGARAIHLQVRHPTTDDMLRDARELASLAGHLQVVVKLPATREGIAAAAVLAADGVPVTLTAVYQVEQVLWAALVGARYAAPYLGRLDDAGRDGLAEVAAMGAALRTYGGRQPADGAHRAPGAPASDAPDGQDANTLRLLVASVRSPEAFRALMGLGVGAITVPVQLFERLIEHEETLAAERAFLADAG